MEGESASLPWGTQPDTVGGEWAPSFPPSVEQPFKPILINVSYSARFSWNVQVDYLRPVCADYLLSLICTSELEKGKDDLMPIFKG